MEGLLEVEIKGRTPAGVRGRALARLRRAALAVSRIEAISESVLLGWAGGSTPERRLDILDVLESVRLVTRSVEPGRPGPRFPRVPLVEASSPWSSRRRGARLRPAPRRISREDPASRRNTRGPPSEPTPERFTNPGAICGRLIEACGLKGERSGAALISPRHANVIVNTGGARAGDVLVLMRKMRDTVAEEFRVTLVPEVEMLGVKWE